MVDISSSSGTVTVANADNGEPGVGALWSYDARVGGDEALSPAETSAARRLAFDDPDGEPFRVVLDVIGHLERGAIASSGDDGGSADSLGEGSSGPTGADALIFELTIDPLLNTVTVVIL